MIEVKPVGEIVSRVNGSYSPKYVVRIDEHLDAGAKLYCKADVDALQARIKELEKDAGRYRWLRNRPEWLGWDTDFRPDEIDRVIEAAIAKENSNGREKIYQQPLG